MPPHGLADQVQHVKKPRPISFGSIFSRKPDNMTPGTDAPRRSISTRISNVSSPDYVEEPNRAASFLHASADREHSEATRLSASDLPPSLMKANLSDIARDDLNKRFSKFTSLPSYATSSASDSRMVQKKLLDLDGTSRFGSVSTASEYPAGTSMKVKSSPPGNRAPKNGTAADYEWIPQGIELPFGMKASDLQIEDIENEISIAFDDRSMLPDEGRPHSNLSLPVTKVVRKPLPITDATGKDIPREHTPDIIVQSPKTPTFAHVKEEPKSPHAKKALRVPFLQKFRHSRTKSKEPPIVDPKGNQPYGQDTVHSFFDDPSSDGEGNNDDNDSEDGGTGGAFVGNAQQASFGRPTLVHHQTPSLNSGLGSKDVLNNVSSGKITSATSTLSSKHPSLLDPALIAEEQRKNEARRNSVIGWPTSEQRLNTLQTTSSAGAEKYQDGDERVSGLWKAKNDAPRGLATAPLTQSVGPMTSDAGPPVDGLRSHPSNAKQKAPKRQVTYPQPIRTAKEKNRQWERGPVTPHPSTLAITHKARRPKHEEKSKDQKANLTVVVYGRVEDAPKVQHLSIPTAAHKVPIKDSEKGEKAIMNRDFDDATLARALFAAYKAIRGVIFATFSARTVRSVKLLGYESDCQLAILRATPKCFENKEEKEGFAHTKLINLYRKPKLGKGRWVWWAWVRGLPENQKSTERSGGKVALELVEGWAATRILIALAMVAFCSVMATLLWIVAGNSRVSRPVPASTSATLMAGNLPAEASMFTSKSIPTGGVAISPSPRTSYADISSPLGTWINGPNTDLAPGVLASAIGVPNPAAGDSPATPTVLQRDTTLTFTSASAFASSYQGGSGDAVTAAPAQATPQESGNGGAGSRLGAGVGLGVLVLLFGWMIVGAWMGVSWYVG